MGRQRRIPLRRRSMEFGLSLLTFVAIVAIWEVTVRVRHVPLAVFPTASGVAISLYQNLADGTFIRHFWVTFLETMVGFFLGSASGAVLGVLIAEVYWVRKLLYPYVVATQSIPKTALAPLFLIWFGFGLASKIAMVVSVTFFPVLINMLNGLAGVDRQQVQLLRAYAATPWQIFRRLKLPNSLPYLFAGLEIAIVLSVIAAVVSEFIGASAGLGYLVLLHNIQLNTAAEFAGLVVLGAMGYGLHMAVQWVARKVVFWQERPERDLGL